jgi:hypothetical protein
VKPFGDVVPQGVTINEATIAVGANGRRVQRDEVRCHVVGDHRFQRNRQIDVESNPAADGTHDDQFGQGVHGYKIRQNAHRILRVAPL